MIFHLSGGSTSPMDYVAKEVGITRTTLYAIEKGNANYSINTLIVLLNFLSINLSLTSEDKTSSTRDRATRINSKLDKKINRFVIMCVEMYARYKNKSDHNIYALFKEKKIIDELINDYEDLHSMGTEWLNNYIDSLLRGKEVA